MTILCPKCLQTGEVDPHRLGRCRKCWNAYDRERYRTKPGFREAKLAKMKTLTIDPHYKRARLERKKARQNQRRRDDPSYREKEIALNHKNKLRRLGLTPNDFERMMLEQSGVCKICKQPETTMKLGRVMKLAVDHDHHTKKIRGLLCNSCNQGLGHFKDSSTRLIAAAEYLQASKSMILPEGTSTPNLEEPGNVVSKATA